MQFQTIYKSDDGNSDQSFEELQVELYLVWSDLSFMLWRIEAY